MSKNLWMWNNSFLPRIYSPIEFFKKLDNLMLPETSITISLEKKQISLMVSEIRIHIKNTHNSYLSLSFK